MQEIVKGLIIPGLILLSDKNLRENVTKANDDALLPRVFGHIFARFCFYQTAIYDQE